MSSPVTWDQWDHDCCWNVGYLVGQAWRERVEPTVGIGGGWTGSWMALERQIRSRLHPNGKGLFFLTRTRLYYKSLFGRSVSPFVTKWFFEVTPAQCPPVRDKDCRVSNPLCGRRQRLYSLHLAVSVRPSVRPKYFWIAIGLRITAPARPSATGLPCIRPCW